MKDKNPDVIRVWFCEECQDYELDFNIEQLYCERCGDKMIPRVYAEVKQ